MSAGAGSAGKDSPDRGLLSFRSAERSAAEVPPRVLAISVFALAIAALAGLLRPRDGARFAGFLWILGLIPPLLLSYYRGWTGAMGALAAGMAVLTLTEVGAELLMDGPIDWWIYGAATTGLVVVSLGNGVMAELFHRRVGTPGSGGAGEVRRREIRRAVEKGQLRLHFQPIVALADRETAGVEAFVRWEHPRRGLLEAKDFVAVAESAGLLAPVGNWAMEEAFRQFAHWQDEISSSPGFFLAINLSTSQCRQPGLVELVRSRLERHGVRGEDLQVEVSEETLGKAGTQIAQFKRLGVGVTVDDVGTGYVSLGQLARLGINALKVDGSFVAQMVDQREDRATVDAIVQVGEALDLPVTAEHVETERQFGLLKELGCDLGQGMFFAAPFPAATLEARRGPG